MNHLKKVLALVLMLTCVITISAQSGTNSPYSQYGLGKLSEQISGFNSGMNGLGIAYREHNQVNYINPASYSSMDSLTFIFDVGLSGQITNFKEGTKSINARNADFEYAIAGFRAFKHVGVSFGLIPYSNVGYDYNAADYVDATHTVTYSTQYYGSGGIHDIFLGIGWEFVKGLSLGANIGYIWGDINHYVVNNYSDSYVNTLSKYYKTSVSSYKLDIGLQYSFKLNKKNAVTLGVTYGLGHKLSSDPECLVVSQNSSTSVSDTTSYSIKNGIEIPTSIGAGILYTNRNRLKIGFDFNYEKWSSVKFPVYDVVNNVPSYELKDDYYSDRYKMILGGEYCYNEVGRRYIERIRLRLGVSYTTPYYKINNLDGPKEFGLSAGFGIPIVNAYNNRSLLNISFKWAHSTAKYMLTENTFLINIGVTFNERWFMKWKFE